MNAGRNSDTISFTMKKQYLYLGLGIVIGFGAGYASAMAFNVRAAVAPDAARALPSFAELATVEVGMEGRPYRGPDDALVTLVEFTDYECPYCGQYFRETYPNLLTEYEGKLGYVVRNFPISALHPQAQKAAEAAECAYEQGKFWEYHDLLFERAPVLGVLSLKAYAADLGLDTGTFNTCVDSGRKADMVAQDMEDGIEYGVGATPTFFLNGRRLVGAVPLADFKSYMDAALEEAQARAPDAQ